MSAANRADLRVHDLLIVGGGINGTGIAADAAGRGLDVVLCEMDDLASATSSASSKLIHGGLRYLEHYEFRLVREALSEREVLLRNAPHIVQPLRFQLPWQPSQRPAWLIRLGLFLYDFLGHRVSLPRSRSVNFDDSSPLVAELKKGFEYYDALVDDSRLVVLNAALARRHGAHILTRTECVGAVTDHDLWRVTLLDRRKQRSRELYARVLVNAAGPWAERISQGLRGDGAGAGLRLVKGCHIVVPRIYEGEQAFLLQTADERVLFVIPWEDRYSLIGTTEEDFQGDPRSAEITDSEINYLINLVNSCFQKKISRDDIVHHFAGVRALAEEGPGGGGALQSPGAIRKPAKRASKVSRDYQLALSGGPFGRQKSKVEHAPILSVYGGKITTYRRLAEQVLQRLKPLFPHAKPAWTHRGTLPGGQIRSRASLRRALQEDFPWLPEELRERWIRSYGSLSFDLLNGVQGLEDMGTHFGHGLYQNEVDYLVRSEWAFTSEDVLWRRSKLGLSFSEEEAAGLEDYLRHDIYRVSSGRSPRQAETILR